MNVVKCLMGWMGCVVVAGQAHAQFALSAKWISYAGAAFYSDAICAIATDSQTNAYFGGRLGLGEMVNVNGVEMQNGFVGGSMGSLDWDGYGFVAKADAGGTLQWGTCLAYGVESTVRALAHSGGEVFAGGVFGSYTDPIWEEGLRMDAIAVSLDAGTGGVLWSHTLGKAENTDPDLCTENGYTAIAVDPSGNVYAAGYTTITNLQTSLPDSAHGGGVDAVVVKYAPSGAVEWVRYLGGADEDTATAIAIGADGSVYVGGQTRSPGWVTLGDPSLPDPISAYGFLAKLDTGGGLTYSTLLGGTGADSISAILKDVSTGALILAGQTKSPDFCSGSGLALNQMSGSADGFVMRLTDLGATCQTNWFRFVGGNGNLDEVNALAWTEDGQVLAGGATGTGNWLNTQGGGAVGYQGGLDGFLLLLDATTGAPLWSTYVGGGGDDGVHALAVGGDTVFAGGGTYSPGFAYDGFWDEWEKEENFWGGDAYGYGFIGKWTPEAGAPPVIVTDVQDVMVHEGDPATFTLVAQGPPSPKYHWTLDGAPVQETSNQFTIPSAAPSDDGALVCCVASNVFGSVTSRVARLTVIANGALTVALTPPEAVAQGARWSVDGGATWAGDGVTVVLQPGTYTLLFDDIAGWTTPTSQTVVVTSSWSDAREGIYVPVVADAARAVSGTNVTLAVQAPPAGLTGWTLVETLPPGVTPTLYAPAAWDGTARTLTFTGTTSASFTYTVTTATSGVYTVSGGITSAPCGITATVTGDTQITNANLARIINGTQVTIQIAPSATFFMVADTLPSGLDIVAGSISSGGGETFNPHTVSWMQPGGQTLSYEVTGPPGTYTLSGTGLTSAFVQEAIYGDSVVVIPDPSVPVPDIVSFTVQGGVGQITFVSVAGQAYMVQTNATLTSGWHDCLPVTGTGPTTTVPNLPAAAPKLFYRMDVRED